MPDLVRSVDDMVADSDMERPLEDSEPAGNTGCAKHRQHVAQVTEELISSQFISGKMRYIEDGTGSKAATKTSACRQVWGSESDRVPPCQCPQVCPPPLSAPLQISDVRCPPVLT